MICYSELIYSNITMLISFFNINLRTHAKFTTG